MKRPGVLAALAAAAVALTLSRTAAAEKKTDGKPVEPFFHQFLIPGDPLDEKLLEQEKRVAADPSSAALRNDFGNLLAERRFPKEARAEYRKATELDPHFFLAAYNLGMLEEIEGQTSAAISAYKKAIDRRRGFPPAHFRLGRVYEKLGRNEDAVLEYAKAIRINEAMRDPKVNPLVVDSRLMDQASLANYPQDVARAALPKDAAFVDEARFRPVPVDRTLDTADVVEEAGPQTIETHKTQQPAGNRAPPVLNPARPTGATRAPRQVAPRPAAPSPTPIPAEPVPPPPEPEPDPEP